MNNLFSFLSGLVFGLGLLTSGMANPQKVLGFLDITRQWDPSLALVMGGALVVGIFGFRIVARMSTPLCVASFSLPLKKVIDKPLVGGSLLFGIGWGIAGICPGPALVLLSYGTAKGWVFFVSMLAGMVLHEWCSSRHHARTPDDVAGTRRRSGSGGWSLYPFQHCRNALTQTDAHGSHAEFHIPLRHQINERGDDACTGTSQRVTERDSSTV